MFIGAIIALGSSAPSSRVACPAHLGSHARPISARMPGFHLASGWRRRSTQAWCTRPRRSLFLAYCLPACQLALAGRLKLPLEGSLVFQSTPPL